MMIGTPVSTGVCRSSFFFNDTATTEIYTLSLHDALPISRRAAATRRGRGKPHGAAHRGVGVRRRGVEPHRGHARGRAATQARDRSRGAATHPHRPQGRLPTREVALRAARLALALLTCVA